MRGIEAARGGPVTMRGQPARLRGGVLAAVALLLVFGPQLPAGAAGTGGIPTGRRALVGDFAVVASGEDAAFRFPCRSGTFPRSGITAIRFWAGSPSPAVSANDVGVLTVHRSGLRWPVPGVTEAAATDSGRESSVAPTHAAVGVPFRLDLGDGNRAVISRWIETPEGRPVGFDYAVEGSGVYVDVVAGRHLYRGRLQGEGRWPGSDTTFSESGSLELVVCSEEVLSAEYVVANVGSLPAAVGLGLGPALQADRAVPAGCGAFLLRVSDAASGGAFYAGNLCDLVAAGIDLHLTLDPGSSLAVVIEAWMGEPVTSVRVAEPPVVSAATAEWAGGIEGLGVPDSTGSVAWPLEFDAPIEEGGGSPLGFLTFVVDDPLEGLIRLDAAAQASIDLDYAPVPPDPALDPAGTAPSPDGVVCPVEGDSWFADSFGAPRDEGRRHRGVDMLAPHGTPLLAAEAGVVTRTRSTNGGYGLFLTTASDRVYYYAHLSAYSEWAVDGGLVPAGMPLGAVGSTGNANVPHLHLGLDVGGRTVNPYPVVAEACAPEGGPDL